MEVNPMSRLVSILLVLVLLLTASATLFVSAEAGESGTIDDIISKNKEDELPELPYTPATETVYVRKFTKAPAIDGSVSEAEWGKPTLENIHDDGKGAFPSTFANRTNNASRADEIKEGALSFSLWLRWDSDNLYLAVMTEDKTPFNSWIKTEPLKMWNGDSLQVGFNSVGNWAMQYGQKPNAFESTNTYSKGVFAVDNKATYGYAGLAGPFVNAAPSDTNAVVKNNGSITTYEIAIAWSALLGAEDSPAAGDIYGLALALVSGSAKAIDNFLTWGDLCLGEPNNAENKKSTVVSSQRVGDNKIILSSLAFDSKEADPEVKKYTVTFYNNNDGEKTKISSYVCEAQDCLREPEMKDQNGLAFSHWEGNYDVALRGEITEDIELVAAYTKMYKVVFRKSKDSSPLLYRQVPAGTCLKDPSARVKNFLRWSSDEYKNVQSDLDIYAITSDVTQDGSGGGSSLWWLWVIIGGVVVVGGGAAAFLVLQKKKASTPKK